MSTSERVLKVRYQLSRQGERVALKTLAARRDVILMAQLARELDAVRDAACFSDDRDLVFTATSGQTIGHRNITGRGLGKTADRAGLEGVTFHALRHTFASILIAQGRDPVFVSRQWATRTPRSRCGSTRTCLTPSVTHEMRGGPRARVRAARQPRSCSSGLIGWSRGGRGSVGTSA